MNKKLDAAFSRKQEPDASLDFISNSDAGKKTAKRIDGKERVSARTMCLPLSVEMEDNIAKLATMKRCSKSAIVRDAIALYVKRNSKDIEKYDAFFGE